MRTSPRGASPSLSSLFVVLGLGVLTLAGTGCTSLGGMRWSSPAPVGHGRVGVGGELDVLHDEVREHAPTPNAFVEYRRGVADGWDVGGRLTVASIAIDTRRAVVRSDAVEASLGAGGRFGLPADRPGYDLQVEDALEGALEPDARIGIAIGRRSQLAFALRPAVVYARTAVADHEKRGLSLRPRLVMAFDIGVTDGFHVVPELSAETFVGADSFYVRDDTLRLRAGLGIYF